MREGRREGRREGGERGGEKRERMEEKRERRRDVERWRTGCEGREAHETEFCFVCFESCICIPLHAARRAMAAALPLPLRTAAGFYI